MYYKLIYDKESEYYCCFDSVLSGEIDLNLEKKYFSARNTLDEYSIKKLNERIINIISNVDEISDEIKKMIKFIESNRFNSEGIFKYDIKKLEDISDVFSCFLERIFDEAIDLEKGCQDKVEKEDLIGALKNLVKVISNIKDNVDAWYGINDKIKFDDFPNKLDDVKRLCLMECYNKPNGIALVIPKCFCFYVVRDGKYITYLDEYIYEKIVRKTNNKENLELLFDEINSNDIREIQQYLCKGYEELFNVMFYRLKLSGAKINKCQNCGKYFIPKVKSNEKYCDRTSPQNPDKTCKEYGANKTYREEVKSDAIKHMHNNISQAYRMRIKRANDDEREQHMKQFEVYKTNYLIRKEKYNKGELVEKDFLIWLKKQREELVNNGKHNTDEK